MANSQGGETAFIIASSAVDDSGSGTRAWSNPSNVTADDATVADVSVNTSNESHWLRASFDFSNLLPINADITGVEVRIQLDGDVNDTQTVVEVQLHNGTVFIGTAKTPNTTIPNDPTNLDYGAFDDTWDATLNLIQIGFCGSAVQFGVRVKSSGAISRTVNADAMWMKIYYGGAGGGPVDNFKPHQGGGGPDSGPTIPGTYGDF